MEGTSAATNVDTHNPTYTEDEVAVIEQAHAGGAAAERESDSDDEVSVMFNISRRPFQRNNNGRGGDESDGGESENSGRSGSEIRNSGAGGITGGGGDSRAGRIGGSNVRVATRRPPRNPPFPNINTDDGKKNGLEIMRCAKRAEWGNFLKNGKRNQWLGTQKDVWFGEMGMFRQYKPLNAQRLSKFITDLCNDAKSSFPIDNHSRDSSGSEDVPPFVLLCREFEDCKSSAPTNNAQQQANRIVNAVVQQTLMEPRAPLGGASSNLRSQVSSDNANIMSGRDNAATLLQNNTSILGLEEEAGVPSGTFGPAARGASLAIGGTTGRRTRGDVISHIDRSRDRQATRLCESLGSILNSIVHPPRTLSDIAKEYREAERSQGDATTDSSKSFWRSLCSKLAAELESFGE